MSALPTRVLLATDGSPDANLASRAAVDLAVKADAQLHVGHSWHTIPSTRFESYIRTHLHQEARELLATEMERIEVEGVAAEAHLMEGPTVDGLLDLAEKLDVDLIVIGSRGLGPVKRLALGSVSEGIVHHALRPVLVLRGGQEAWPPERIVIGDDGSEAARDAGGLAAAVGHLFDAKALLVRSYPRLPDIDTGGREMNARTVEDDLRREERALEERAAEIEEAHGIRPRVRIAAGEPTTNLLEAAREDALIALGSRGLGAMQRVRLGSVSTKVLRAADGPVLIYSRPPKDSE